MVKKIKIINKKSIYMTSIYNFIRKILASQILLNSKRKNY